MVDDDSWVFDSLVGFLKSPVWHIPILTYIEDNSLFFERGVAKDSDHRRIHEDYKTKVDLMLGSFMDDLGISPEQFEAACGKSSSNIKQPFHQELFQQVWAADDFNIFKRMMIQKNKELEFQALLLLYKRYNGALPDSIANQEDMCPEEKAIMQFVIKSPNDSETEIQEAERNVLEIVLKRSMEEHDSMVASLDDDTKRLEKDIVSNKKELERLEVESRKEKMRTEEAVESSIGGQQPEQVSSETHTSTPSVDLSSSEKSDINPEQLRLRQEYLRAQRDKLLQLKRQERERQLVQFEKASKQPRPKSSRAARSVIKGGAVEGSSSEVRKALAEQLKAEVINK